ncbi:hypothetical protein GQR60_13895 [Labilibaculum sp. A4]|uniref:hypothetical protein n=1 Tax=Labilibaculum euxinus TaxID=2686357 RepID=UPI000F616D8E|nr:hypothetical protein [Labilibaculum euxinus]MDQ1770013.1 hypothetical protein [Labilibaculum euxinus]MWN77435.1 hypothetical protein [Labilibaculum euxinus]
MKTYITFLLAFFLFSQANLFAQKNRLNKEGEKEGRWEEYFKDGKLAATGAYKNGKKKESGQNTRIGIEASAS